MATNHIFWTVLAGAAGLLGAAGCSYGHGDPAPIGTCDVSPQAVTYGGVVSPIFDAHCRKCHGSSVAALKGGGNDFGSHTAINRYPSATLLGCIRHAPGYDPMPQNQAKLSDCDIRRIEAWVANSKPNN